MNYTIIGTAGHIDHGKSSLIKALTGFWGDESNEEKRRGITIDLSFSYLKRDEQTIAFIDVPGHEKLTSTMISGAYGFDACLIVIDVNEGIMPQTKEHLHILNFLGKKSCIVALSKCDLATQEQIMSKSSLIRKELDNYQNLHIKAIVNTSIKDDKSIENLKNKLFDLPPIVHEQTDVLRYFIDRVFNIKGHGVVVTGTLFSGQICEEQKIWISECEKMCEVKSLQVHEKKVQKANPRQRVAINLNKIKLQDIKKGMQITQKGYIRGFKSVDLYLENIKEIIHNSQVALHVGSKKIMGTILKIHSGFFTFQSKEAIYSVFNDKCIISHNGEVIAGGVIINPISDPIKKRKKISILKKLKEHDFKGAFLDLSLQHKKGFGLICAYQRFALSHEDSLEILRSEEGIFVDEEALVIYPISSINECESLILNIFKKNPYALLSEKSLKLKYHWISEKLALKALKNLHKKGKIILTNGVWAKSGIDAKNLQNNLQNKIFTMLKDGGFSPKAPYNIYDELDIDRKTGDDAMKALTKAKKVIRLEHNFFITSDELSAVMAYCREIIEKNGYVDIKNLKEKIPLSRKYLIGFLEYLDKFDDIKKDGVKRLIK